MQSGTVPRHQAAGAGPVLDGVMSQRLAGLPRPHRFDVLVALAGLLLGLLLWGIGLGTRPADDPVVLWEGRWPILVPLVVMAGCEVLRRVVPRPALLVGTAAIVLDTVTQGSWPRS